MRPSSKVLTHTAHIQLQLWSKTLMVMIKATDILIEENTVTFKQFIINVKVGL